MPTRPPTRRRRPAAPLLLHAKLQRPNLEASVLERPALLAELAAHAGRPLTLLTADAGWGKTTLAADFVRRAHRPVVWYALQSSDSDLRVFGLHLLAGFRQEAPRFGAACARLLDDPRPIGRGAEMLAEVFAQALGELKGPPRLLVLDDFHAVAGAAEVVTFVDALLRVLPAGVRLLLTSRTVPPLALERMRVRGEVFELDAARLRLAREEIAALALARLGRAVEPAELERLEDATAGWPTAVRLVLEALRREPERPFASVVAELRVPEVELRAFFAAEVYRRLEPAARELLEHTAVFERFDAPLAAALARQRDARGPLDALARRGLLRSFGAGAGATYEWNGPVRAFVRDELTAREGAEGMRAREAAAADVLRGRGEPERALRHLLAAGDGDGAAALLRELAPRLLREGRASTLLAYFEAVPVAAIAGDAALLLARADAHAALGRWDEAERDYGIVLEDSRRGGGRAGECRALLGLGKVLNLRGRHEQVLGMSERGLALADRLPLELHARLLQMKASAHFYLGQYRAAIALLGRVRELLPAGADPELVVPTLHNLAIAYASQGRFREASESFRAALAQVRGTSSPRAPLYLSNLAFLLLEMGELAEARRAAEEGLQAAQRFSNRAQEATCLEAVAESLAQGGDLDGALAALRRAEELHDQLRMEVISADLLAARGRIFCARGQYGRALEFLTQAVERASTRPDAPRQAAFRAQLAWCELRAARPHAARRRLAELLPAVDQGENDDERMRVHYWLAEAMLAIGERRGVEAHLQAALRLVREHGYAHFLRQRAREDPAPVREAMARGIEVETCAAALAEAGDAAEEALLALAESAPVAVAEAALGALAESGGEAALARLPAVARRRRSLQAPVRATLRGIAARGRRVAAAGTNGSAPPRLVVFGPPRLELDGRALPPSAWRAQRAFHLLLLLALRPRGATRDELMETFWPGRQAAAGRRNFHPTLSYVRSVLPRGAAPPLLREGEVYRLNPAYAVSCDAWEWESELERARRERGASERLAALERAVALAERPPLEGVYGAWAEEVQRRWRDRQETTRIEAGRLRQQAGDAERALEHFRRAVELDEFRETTYVSLIECLMALGNRGAALAEYDRLRARLRRELAVDPLPETEEAVRRALGAAAADPAVTV